MEDAIWMPRSATKSKSMANAFPNEELYDIKERLSEFEQTLAGLQRDC